MYSGEADAGLAAAKQDSAAAATAVQSLSTKVEQQGDAIVAQGAAVTALDTRLTVAEGVATGQASALQQLDSKVTQQGDALTAQASSLSQLSAEVDDASAAVQTTQQAVAGLQDGLQAMYSVKLQVTSNGKIYGAGMGIGIENTPSGMQSQVLFQADRFAVINTANGAISTPFVIQSGQVYINSAIIGDSTIGMAKIADVLQSTDYIAGQRGWRLTKAGSFELNSTVAGQGRLVMTNQRIEIYDVNGVLRVRLGIW
nr:DUF1983 domain-containing protein [Pseudomonas citronellolis]